MIRHANEADSKDIASIYNYYIENTVITFEEHPVFPDTMLNRISKVKAAGLPWYVSLEQGSVIGYAYATPWNERSAYRKTVEVSIYLSHEHRSRGIGTDLYQTLFKELKSMPIHIVIGGVTLPNAVSVSLHEKFGMHKVAHFEEVGFKHNQWWDVGYWQVKLEDLKLGGQDD